MSIPPGMLPYLAFGSNLTPARLFARVGLCEVLGVATIPGHRMSFRKRGGDNSGKCDLFASTPDDVAEGVVFLLPESMRPTLDRFEGVGNGYEVVTLGAVVNGQALDVVAYQAQPPFVDDDLKPYGWYRDYVLEGGRRFGLSSRWIRAVEQQAVDPDPDPERSAKNAAILAMSDAAAAALKGTGRAT